MAVCIYIFNGVCNFFYNKRWNASPKSSIVAAISLLIILAGVVSPAWHGTPTYRIHSSTSNKLPKEFDKFSSSIKDSYVILGDKSDKIIECVKNISNDIRVCHGDFHPDNILVSSKEPIAIDWTNAYVGNPLGDVARTCLFSV